MRNEVGFLSAVAALMLLIGCARSAEPSESGAGSTATGVVTTPPSPTLSSPPTRPDGASAATATPKVAFTLFRNVRIFDGKADKLTDARNVMVHGNIIERISSGSIPMPADAKVTVIDSGGRTLMPGLIDAHWHAMLVRQSPAGALTAD